MTKTYLMNSLIEEMQSPDQNFRWVEASEAKVLNQVLSLVEDKISEVKSQIQLIKIQLSGSHA
ncbi:hypothetical protein BDZ89DRAFT_1137545 [Hymenopellis radicata]|nr:hypothetical protein BDZ89DRAFT_1137545 [Hymenopellis radicata]